MKEYFNEYGISFSIGSIFTTITLWVVEMSLFTSSLIFTTISIGLTIWANTSKKEDQ